MQRIHPCRSSRSSVAVIVADAASIRSLTCEGVTGSPAPSITARAVSAACGNPNVTRMHRSISAISASPVRTSVAYASVQLASPPGNSSAKSAPTRTTPSEAGEGRFRPFPGLAAPPGSGISEDLDPRRALHAGPVHGLAQRRIPRESACLRGARKLVRDEQVVPVLGQPQNTLRGAAVLRPQRLDLVVHLPPRCVVTDLVTDRQDRAHISSPPSCEGSPAP